MSGMTAPPPLRPRILEAKPSPLYVGYKLSYFNDSDWTKSVGGSDLSPEFTDGLQAIEPGSSGTVRLKLFRRGQVLFDRYGAILGYVTCSIGTTAEDFYIDLGDYTPE